MAGSCSNDLQPFFEFDVNYRLCASRTRAIRDAGQEERMLLGGTSDSSQFRGTAGD